jgi:hypothetical protein
MGSREANKNIRKRTALLIAVLLIAVIVLTSILIFRNPPEQQQQQQPSSGVSLKAPSNLTASTVTATGISLYWKDNSNNEQGLRLYRDGVVIANLPENTTIYEDMNLKPATNYTYKVEVYSATENFYSLEYKTKTLNPPINILVDKIGVHENGEDLLRDLNGGEVNLGVVVTDGKNTVQIRLPDKDFYQLKNDETIDVKQQVFSSNEIGDTLRIVIIGYEDDGDTDEQFTYKIMDIIVKSYLGGPASALLELAGLDFTKVFSNLFGAEDDWLGTYASELTSSQNWGVGNYIDIKCTDKDGNIGLIISFRIECPVYDYSA